MQASCNKGNVLRRQLPHLVPYEKKKNEAVTIQKQI